VWSVLYARPGAGIQSVLDIRHRTVGLMRGDVNGEHFRDLCARFNLPLTIRELGTFEEVLQAVASGQVDGGVTTNIFGYSQESRFKVDRTPVVFSPFDLYFATRKGRNADLLGAVDAYLRAGKLHSDSGYHRAMNRWLAPPAKSGLPPWVTRLGLATLTALVLAILVALAFRRQVRSSTAEIRLLNAELKRELALRKLIEDRILMVAEGLGASTGASFLNHLARHLAMACDADIAFVGELTTLGGVEGVRTLTVFQDGAPGADREWVLAGSASEGVLRDGSCVFPAGVQATFPADETMRESNLESYAGNALRDSGGRVLGVIGVMSRQPLSNPALATALLGIFSARASAELERQVGERARQELERQMQHAQKLESLGVLAGGIAHDFNNLLTAMLGHMNVAQMKLAPESPAMPHLENLERIIHRAADLTRQMLAYSGKGRFVVRAYDLNHVVREVTHLLEVAIPKKIVLRFDLAQSLPAVEADAAQIQQVIMNLVTNAADAIGDREGTIRLSTSALALDRSYLDQVFHGQNLATGTYVTLEVSDTGCGMTPEVMNRIFEPFFTTKVTGRGLGLSATMGILKGHRAGMRIYSEPGRGTTFKLLFPSSEARREEEAVQATVPALAYQATILLVDDEEMIRDAAAAVLESLGLTVIPVADGLEAVEAVQRPGQAIDLVLMDLTMPRMDGREAFHAIRRIHPHLPVILSSGYNEQESIQAFMGRGLAPFRQKPYTLRALERTVLAALGTVRRA
jgi:signal transduction histidine kinase/ActR/RegA family two-component response regulator